MVIISPTNPIVDIWTEFIESSKDIPITEIKTVVSANSTTTVFGAQTVSLVAISTDHKTIEVIISFNPSTNEIKLINYEVLEVLTVSGESVTNFKVDVLTGTKTTTTNDTTVIASSQITTTLIAELQVTHTELASQTILSSTTVEYQDVVKVISVFAAEINSHEVTQVTSIYDK